MVSLIIDFFKKMKIGILGVFIVGAYMGINRFVMGDLYGALASFFGAIFGGGIILILLYFFKPSKEKKS